MASKIDLICNLRERGVKATLRMNKAQLAALGKSPRAASPAKAAKPKKVVKPRAPSPKRAPTPRAPTPKKAPTPRAASPKPAKRRIVPRAPVSPKKLRTPVPEHPVDALIRATYERARDGRAVDTTGDRAIMVETTANEIRRWIYLNEPNVTEAKVSGWANDLVTIFLHFSPEVSNEQLGAEKFRLVRVMMYGATPKVVSHHRGSPLPRKTPVRSKTPVKRNYKIPTNYQIPHIALEEFDLDFDEDYDPPFRTKPKAFRTGTPLLGQVGHQMDAFEREVAERAKSDPELKNPNHAVDFAQALLDKLVAFIRKHSVNLDDDERGEIAMTLVAPFVNYMANESAVSMEIENELEKAEQ